MSTKTKTDALEVNEPLRPIITTWLNFSADQPEVFEFVPSHSETAPDQVLDLRTMLERSASGIPVPTRADGYSDEDYPDIWKMDEFELASFREGLADDMTKMQDELHVASKRLEELENEQREKRKNAVTNEQQTEPDKAPKKAD